jgi:hypothetical protein
MKNRKGKIPELSRDISREIDVSAPIGKVEDIEGLYAGLEGGTSIEKKIKVYYDGRQHTLRLPTMISRELGLKHELKAAYTATITLDQSGDKPKIILEIEKQ